MNWYEIEYPPLLSLPCDNIVQFWLLTLPIISAVTLLKFFGNITPSGVNIVEDKVEPPILNPILIYFYNPNLDFCP